MWVVEEMRVRPTNESSQAVTVTIVIIEPQHLFNGILN